MATVINNPSSDSSSAAGWGIAVVVLVLAVIFGLPMLRNAGGPAISVPESIDVNVGGGGAGTQ